MGVPCTNARLAITQYREVAVQLALVRLLYWPLNGMFEMVPCLRAAWGEAQANRHSFATNQGQQMEAPVCRHPGLPWVRLAV